MSQVHPSPTPNPYGNFGFRTVTANALRTPDKVAITYLGEQRITYGQLNARVNRMAHALLEVGIEPGTRVASLLGDTLNVVDVYLSESKIGATVAALNPYWPPETIAAVTERSQATAFVYDQAFAEVVEGLRPRLPNVTTWLSIDVSAPDTTDLAPLAAAATEAEPPLAGFGDDEWMFLYTSGTTGTPKAVRHTHASGLAIAGIWTDVPHDDRSIWGAGPIIWGSGFPSIIGTSFYAGMGVALENDFGPAAAIQVIEREKVTHVAVVPSFWTEVFRTDDHLSADLSSLQVVILGAEPLLPSLLDRIRDRIPGTQLMSFYGCAEAPYTTVGRLDDGSQDLRSSGRARAGVAVKVIDKDGNRVVGEVGTLCHAGPHVMRDYFGQPEVTAEVLRDGWFVGEDLGVMAEDGTITVMGRRSDAISTPGGWVQPTDVEDAALAVPGVVEAGAVGVPEEGDEQRILLAVAPAAGKTLDAATIEAALKEALPEHSQPAAIVVAGEGLPHNEQAAAGTGKLLRSEIRRRWADRVPT